MTTPIFVDTGAWFARIVTYDRDHPSAGEWFDLNTHSHITTDYIIDELLTLLKIRGEYRRALEIGPSLLNGDVCDLEFATRDDIKESWRVYSTYQDKGWSFTDCVGRVVMERFGVTTAAAFDDHFHQFGTVKVVP